MRSSIQNFIFHCEFEKGLSKSTLKAYKIDLEQFYSFIINEYDNLSINQINKHQIKAYIQNISTQKAKTTKRKLATLKAMFNFLEFEEELEINPFRKIKINIKEPQTLPVVLTLDEVGSVLKMVYNKMYEIKNLDSMYYKQTVRDIAIIELLFATGIRVSELCNLMFIDVCSEFTSIIVNGKGNKQRVIGISNNDTKNILKKYYGLFQDQIHNTGYFFINRIGKRLSEQSVRFAIDKYCKELKFNKKVTPHVFRHSFATLLLEEDVDIRYIQSLLGHSSINVTQIYTHVSSKKQKDIILNKHPRKHIHI
ncbi:MAG: tyrosine-type recombinase/integrase [Bacteroidales bacterium]|nr:tyrosine-type recombinase/integrase [Bacteroidales bacterium]